MKNSQFYYNAKGDKVEIWFEEVNNKTDFWEKTNGISKPLTEKQYLNRVKKNNLENLYV